MERKVTVCCIDFDVEFEVFGRNRAATFYDPPEYEEVEVECICIEGWDVTNVLDRNVIDQIKNELYANLYVWAAEERDAALESRAEELAEMRMLGEAA